MGPKEKAKASAKVTSGLFWALIYGDGILAIASLCLVLTAAVLWHSNWAAAGARQHALQEEEKMSKVVAEQHDMSNSLNEKTQALDAANRKLAEAEQLLTQNKTAMEDMQKKLEAAQSHRGKASAGRGKRRGH